MVFAKDRGVQTGVVFHNDGTASITKVSNMSGKTHTLTMKMLEKDYNEWKSGNGLIQNVMPYLTPDEREFLMTGITAQEWDYIFKDDEGSD